MMRARDWEYIDTRLLAPCVPASEAHERLVSLGMHKEAEILMNAMQDFIALTRDLRHLIADGMRGG